MASIELEQISKMFGSYPALHPLDLHICDGEFFTLLGPSGCGKTTLLRIIAGLEKGTTGHITIGTKNVTSCPPRDRDIALVFQDYALYPHLSVKENLAFPLRAKNTPPIEIDTKVMGVARRLHVDMLLERRPRQLSGGQQQRVALGRAIVRSPKVFLMDEPLSNLDAKLRIDMRAELRRLQRDLGITTIYVTHDQEEAMTMSDRIAVMRDGVIQQCGPPVDIYRCPTNKWVASFVGSPHINLFDVASEPDRDGMVHVLLSEKSARSGTKVRMRCSGSKLAAGHYQLGVRPEDLSFEERPGPEGIRGQVDIAEFVGDHFIITVRTEFGLLKVKTYTKSAPLIGQDVSLRVNESSLHLFAIDSGKRVGS